MIHARPDIYENELVKIERHIPTGFNPGDMVSITVSITTRVPLLWLEYKDFSSPGLTIIEGESSVSAEEIEEGATLALQYYVTADAPGTFFINGEVAAQAEGGPEITLKAISVLSSGFVYSREDNEFYTFERWINPASIEPGGNFPVTWRLTARAELQSVNISEKPPSDFSVVHGDAEVNLTGLAPDRSVTHVYILKAGDKTGILEMTGTILVEQSGGSVPPVEVTTPLYVFPPILIDSIDDPAWRSTVGPGMTALVNSSPVNQHLFLANALRLIEERLNVSIASGIRVKISQDFFLPELSGVDAEVGGLVPHNIFIGIAQHDMTIYPVKEVILQDEKECEEADEMFDFSRLKEVPDVPFEAGPDPGLGSNFDTVLQVQREVFDLGLRLFVKELRATSQDRYTYNLPWGLGSITGIIDSVEVPGIRPGTSFGGALADIRGSFRAVTTGLFKLLTGGGTASLEFQNVGIGLTQTPSGVPTGIKIVLTALRLGLLRLNLSGFLGWLLNQILPPILRFGIWIALRFIRSVDVPVWPLVDAFTKLGLSYAQGSPVLTAIADAILLATDLKPHDNAGVASGLQNIIPPSSNIGVAVNERLLNQVVCIAIAKGYLPRSTRVGKVTMNLSYLNVYLRQGTLGIEGQLKARRKSCLCGVKAKIRFEIEISPRIESDQTGTARLMLLTGAQGKPVNFGPTTNDKTTVEELALHCAQPVSGVLSGDLSTFPSLTSAASSLHVTIDGEGPHTVTLASVPANLTQAQSLLQDAIRNAHASTAFSRAQVLPVDNRLLVLSGNAAVSANSVPVVFAVAPGDATTVNELALDIAQAVQVFMSEDLSTFPALTSTAPEVEVTIGTEGPHIARFSGVPADLSAAQSQLQDAIRNAHTSPDFAQSGVVVAYIDPPALAFDFNADIRAKVEVSGILGVTLWLTFGVLLISLWAMLNQVFSNNLNQLIANLGNQIINNSLPAQTGYIRLSIPGLSPSGLLGVRLHLALKGAGLVSLQPFTCAPLGTQWMKIGFSTRSIEVDDEEIRLAVKLS